MFEPFPSDQAKTALRGPEVQLSRAPAELTPRSTEPRLSQLQRTTAALLRHRWIVLLTLVMSGVAGLGLKRFVHPTYSVHGTIWISSTTSQEDAAGPIRAAELMNATSWPELLRSFAVLDDVTRQLRLYVHPGNPKDLSLFTTFDWGNARVGGRFELLTDTDNLRYTLRTAKGNIIEQGAVGDSIGRSLGIKWLPHQLPPNADIPFSVESPRDASVVLRQHLEVTLPESGNLMQVVLSGSDPQQTAHTMNTLFRDFVAEAAELKTRHLVEFSRTLQTQLGVAEQQLKDAEIALENFRVGSITQPSEGTAVSGGVALARDPMLTSFFNERIAYDSVRHDREQLEATLSELEKPGTDVNILWSIPSVQGDPNVRAALTDFASKEAALRAARQTYTDEYRTVRQLRNATDTLRLETIPQLAHALAGRLRRREDDLSGRIEASSRELRRIPTRTIEEMRLRRNVEVRENLYTTLKNRFEEARLSEVSAIPDVVVLDSAVAPLGPTATTGPKLLLIVGACGIGLAVLLAIGLDRADHRFRYPEQVTHDLGLTVLGAVPHLPATLAREPNSEVAFAVTESFRWLRLSLQHAAPQDRIAIAVSSPGPSEGKSLICANLALSFAHAGFSTVLVDGDLFRGGLAAMFTLAAGPGLQEYLTGQAPLDSVIQRSSDQNLALISRGRRLANARELLTSPALERLMSALRSRFDVVIIDTPPLGAGVDALVFGTAAQQLLLVMRHGRSNWRIANGQLQLAERLPIRLVGAVLNDVALKGSYSYYSSAYAATRPEPDEDSGLGRHSGLALRG